jgi:hypothetical protein
LLDERRNILLNGFPSYFFIHAKILMNQHVSDSLHRLSGDQRIGESYFFGNGPDRFANGNLFEGNGSDGDGIAAKRVDRLAVGELLNIFRAVQNVLDAFIPGSRRLGSPREESDL